MQRSLPEVVQGLAINHRQIDERGVTEVKIGTRQLLEVFLREVFLDHPRPVDTRTSTHFQLHAGHRSQVDMRVDEAGNKKLPLSGNDGCARSFLYRGSPFDLYNA